MNSVLRALFVYLFLLILFRLSGKRTLSQATPFDLILLLIISETTQQAMVDSDHSLTNCFLLVITLLGASIVLSELKEHFPGFERLIEGSPLIIVERGKMHPRRMSKTRISEEDILSSARMHHGLERMEDIKYAILETSGDISIIPQQRD